MAKLKVVRRQGGSKVLTVSDVLPPDWQAVLTIVTKKTAYAIHVRIEKVA